MKIKYIYFFPSPVKRELLLVQIMKLVKKNPYLNVLF